MIMRRRTKRKLLIWALVLTVAFIGLVAVASAGSGGCWMARWGGGCFLF